jgi:hypothetical protein
VEGLFVTDIEVTLARLECYDRHYRCHVREMRTGVDAKFWIGDFFGDLVVIAS